MKNKIMITSLIFATAFSTGCHMQINNRSQVHYIDQKAEYDGKIVSYPSDSSSGSSVNAEKTTEAATSVSTSSGSATSSGNADSSK